MSPPHLKGKTGWMLGVGLVTACGSNGSLDTTSQTGEPPSGAADDAAAPRPEAGPPIFHNVDATARVDRCEPADTGAGPFAAFAVSDDDIGRPVIYSWTSAEQIAELRADPTLLTRSMTTDGYRGRAADTIAAMASYDEIAAILDGSDFQNKRFGWSNPWATLLGWPGETYGTELLAIRLRPEAYVGRLDASTGKWAFFDVRNDPVSLDAVKASPERIAAIFFVDSFDGGGCGGTLRGAEPFREYVVCNEAMVESWSAYTPEIRAELVAGIGALEAFRDALVSGSCVLGDDDAECWRDRALSAWQADPIDLLEGYEASLAFPNPSYMPTLGNLDALIAAVQAALFDPAPLVHQYP